MNVAKLELCKELYELSGWGKSTYEPTRWWWKRWDAKDSEAEACGYMGTVNPSEPAQRLAPAYDLGYLLGKLPNYLEYWAGGNESGYLQLIHFSKHWSCGYEDENERGQSLMQHLFNTPEDAAAKLAIELFKQSILPQS